MFLADFDKRTQLFQSQLLESLLLCGCDTLKSPCEVVRHFDGKVCHGALRKQIRDDYP